MAEGEEKPKDVSIRNLDEPDVLAWLAALCSVHLKVAGSVTFFIDEDGYVQLANPLGVFLDIERMKAPEKPYRFVRPIITDGRPQYIAVREDGTIWEIEFTDEAEAESRGG